MTDRPVQYAAVPLPGALIDGACRDHDVNVFFPGRGDMTGIARAVAICRTCEVREVCLDFAIESDEHFGIWGGLTGRQRRVERRRRRYLLVEDRESTALE